MPLPNTDPDLTLRGLLLGAKSRLKNADIPEGDLLADLLASTIFGIQRGRISSSPEFRVSGDHAARFQEGIDRILAHEPLQYVLGEAVFMGYTLKVSPAVLIPRPETEQLVELAVTSLRAGGPGATQMELLRGLDIGTGSGNISISLCKMLPGLKMLSVDASELALLVAKQNIVLNGLTDYIETNYLDVLKSIPALPHRIDFIISNPPYISAEEFDQLEPHVRTHEPTIALTDEADGLTFYRRIAEIGPMLLKPDGRVFLEVSYDQAFPVSEIFRAHGYADIRLFKDYPGIERFVSCRLGKS